MQIDLNTPDGLTLDAVRQARAYVLLHTEPELDAANAPLPGAFTISTGGTPNPVIPNGVAISGNVGNYGRSDVSVMINTPIVPDSVFGRLTVASVNSDGYFTNIVDNSQWGNDNRVSGIAQLRILPTDDLTIDILGEMARKRGLACTGIAEQPEDRGFPLLQPFRYGLEGLVLLGRELHGLGHARIRAPDARQKPRKTEQIVDINGRPTHFPARPALHAAFFPPHPATSDEGLRRGGDRCQERPAPRRRNRGHGVERRAVNRDSLVEINFDGIVGPSHNYAGLSLGNLAATAHAGTASYPRSAALQGLAKMRHNLGLGLAQGFFVPLPRPNPGFLDRLGAQVDTDAALTAAAWSAFRVAGAKPGSGGAKAATASTSKTSGGVWGADPLAAVGG